MQNRLKISSALALAATAAGVVAVPAVAASAATAPVPAHYAGMWMTVSGGGRYWVGSDLAIEHGRKVITDCVIPGAALKTPTKVRAGIYGTARQSAELSYVMTEWGTSQDNRVAAAGRLALLDILGREIKGLQAPSGITSLAAAYVRDAKASAGPYRAAVTFGPAPAPAAGKTGTVSVTISAGGHVLTGIPVRLTATGAKLSGSGRSGHAVKFTRTGDGKVTVTASASVPPGEVTIGTAPQGQTLIGEAAPVTAAGSASLKAVPAPPKPAPPKPPVAKVRADVPVLCVVCPGKREVSLKLTSKVPAGYSEALVYDNGGQQVTVSVPAGSSKTVTVTVPKGQHLTYHAEVRHSGAVVAVSPVASWS